MCEYIAKLILTHFVQMGKAVFVLALLLTYLGYPALAGYVVMVLMLPLQIWLGKIFARLSKETASFTGMILYI